MSGALGTRSEDDGAHWPLPAVEDRAHGCHRDRGRPQCRQGRAVQDCSRGQCRGVEQEEQPLDAREAEAPVRRRDPDHLHAGRAAGDRGHEEQLTGGCRHGHPRRRRRGVQPGAEGVLQCFDGLDWPEQPGDGIGAEDVEPSWRTHRRRNPPASSSSASATNRCSPVGKAVPVTTGTRASLPSIDQLVLDDCTEARADHRVVDQRRSRREQAARPQDGDPGRRSRPARGPVHLAVREDGDVALVEIAVSGVAQVLVEHGPVDAVEPLVVRVLGVRAGVQGPLHLAPEGDEGRKVAGGEGQPEGGDVQVRVEGATEADVDGEGPPAGRDGHGRGPRTSSGR